MYRVLPSLNKGITINESSSSVQYIHKDSIVYFQVTSLWQTNRKLSYQSETQAGTGCIVAFLLMLILYNCRHPS